LATTLASAKGLTPQLVAYALRDLVEANTVASRRDDAAEYLQQLGRHLRQVRSATALLHYRRHLARIPGMDAPSPISVIRQDHVFCTRSKRNSENLLSTRGEILEDLCAAAELHDDPSGRHAYRVAELARRLALAIGLPDAEAGKIGLAARLHDIGKI